jgi:EmrB/QacA subfamily drug resistance transporter
MRLKEVSPQPQVQPSRRLQGWVLFSVLAAQLLSLWLEALDSTIIGTALPHITASLHGFADASWVVTAYLLASVTMIPLAGKLSDQFGRKWFLVGGTALFLLGSACAGGAQSMSQLVAFRAVQGFGAGTGIALVFTAVADLFPPAERARWQGIYGAVAGIANLVGPVLGGWFTDHGPLLGHLVTEPTRWRWIFYVNLPIGLLALLSLVIFLPPTLSQRSSTHTGWEAVRRIDVGGAVLMAGATMCLLLSLSWGSEGVTAWERPQVIGTLGATLVLFLGFVVVEHKAVEPILPLGLFRSQVVAADLLLALLQGMILTALAVYLPFSLQSTLGVSASSAGTLLISQTVCLSVGALLSAVVITHLKRHQAVIIVGSLLLTVGVFLLMRLTPTSSVGAAVIAMILSGLGLGTFFPVLNLVVQNTLPATHMGVATAAVNYLRQLGQTLGVAVMATVITTVLAGRLPTEMAAQTASRLTMTDALQWGYGALLIFCGVIIVTCCFLKDTTMNSPASCRLQGIGKEPPQRSGAR